MSHLSERAEAVQTWLEGEWSQCHLKGKRKTWESRPLVARLKREGRCQTELDGWEALYELAAAGVIEAPAVVSSRQRLNVRVRLSEALCHRLASEVTEVDDSLGLNSAQAAAWRHALDGVLQDWSLVDQQCLASGLRRLAAALPDAYALSAFEASAHHLLGSSKLLTALPRELVRSFGIDTSAFRGPVAWVLAAVPDSPQGLLLIENPQSFDQACRVGLNERLALVCSFGYGLSLGEALKSPEQVRLIGEGGSSHRLTELLALPNITFWGDLDPEGLRIFSHLRHSLPGLRLSALYAPMMARLEADDGHPLHALTGKAKQRPGTRWSRGLDQELIDDATLAAGAGKALEDPLQQRWLQALADGEE
ncbi:Wadjet anti-phage system protein JetD domain-containing protein [Halomonas sp. WWR20]